MSSEQALVKRDGEGIETYAPLAPVKVDPEAVVAEATKQANVLMRVVKAAGLAARIGAKEHLFVEAWQTIAKFNDCVIDTGWTREVVRDGVRGFEAQARLRRLSDGAVLATAEGSCMWDEQLERDDGTLFDRWSESYAVQSMAQTRAQGKVGRMAFAWVAVLAGYASTPAEEMDGVRKATKITFPFGDHKGQSPADLTLAELKKDLPFWLKKGQEPGKYQAGNARIAKAIEEAIAEKSAPVTLQDADGNPVVLDKQTGEVTKSQAAAPESVADPQPPSVDPGPREAAFIRLNELIETKGWTKAKVAMLANRLYPESRGVLSKLAVEQIEAICTRLREEG